MKSEKKKIILVCLACLLISTVLYLLSGTPSTKIEGSIKRGQPGERAAKYRVDVCIEDEIYKDIDISVQARDYSPEEFYEICEANQEKFLAKMLQDNKSIQTVDDDLLFFNEFENYPFEFTWLVDEPGKINEKGTIISAEAFDAFIDYRVSYKSFYKDYGIPIHVEPSELIIRRVKEQNIKNKINEIVNLNAMISNEELILPAIMNGKKVDYYFSETSKNPVILLFGIGSCVAFFLAFKRDERKKEEDKKQLMLREYTKIVQIFSLYLITGMQIRTIWERICSKSESKTDNPVYLLMQQSKNEMHNGISDEQVLMNFAERTGLPEYVRLSALILQNQKKGSTRLSEALREETMKAFLQKKQMAIKEGEQAGTKLLFPMMIILVDVMVMIIVPAFQTI